MKSCKKCLLNEAADTITYNSAGVCGVCENVAKKYDGTIDWAARRADLDVIAASARARGDQYDCLLPYSGGKDSTYQLWFVVTQLKLRPLVVRYNHWHYRAVSERNNERTLKKLGVDFIDFRVNWHVVKEMQREALIRRGDFCLPCHEGVAALPMQMALKFKTPLLIYGESIGEYSQHYALGGFEEWDETRYHRAMSLGILPGDMYEFLKDRGIDRRDLMPFEFPAKADLDALGVRAICLGDYVPWETRKQVKIIERELGWEGDEVEGVPPDYSYEKIECRAQGCRDWLRYIKRGQGRSSHLANIDIRHGRITREQGAALAAEYDGKEPASLGWFLNMVDMTREEFYEIALSHVVDPWEMNLGNLQQGPALHDMKDWT